VDRDDISAILRKTLEDHRMSRGEKQALTSVLREADPAPRDHAILRGIAFDLAREEIGGADSHRVLDWLEDAVRVIEGRAGEETGETFAAAAFTPGKDCLGRVTGLLAGARETADLCVFTITDDRIARAIEKAHRRGVAVRIVTDDEKATDPGTDIPRLKAAGIPVVVDDSPNHMHHKFAVFDGSLLLTGSFNWTRSATDRNQENLVVTDDRRLVVPFGREFERLWRELFR
jgi:phosphatidylserine/phosphatidylglycerophosphate/cardiolipin synthase-like enzyme